MRSAPFAHYSLFFMQTRMIYNVPITQIKITKSNINKNITVALYFSLIIKPFYINRVLYLIELVTIKF